MESLTQEQKVQMASQLAGQEAMSGLLALVNASEEDYNKLVEKNQTGKTILIKDEEGQIRGIGILKTTSSVEESLDFLNVAHLYTKEMDETHISLMMKLIEQYAVHLNLTSVRIGINGNDNLVINELFGKGYRLANLSQKMIYNQYCSSVTNKLYGALLG